MNTSLRLFSDNEFPDEPNESWDVSHVADHSDSSFQQHIGKSTNKLKNTLDTSLKGSSNADVSKKDVAPDVSEGIFQQPFTPMFTPQSRQELTHTLNTCLERSSHTDGSKKDGVSDLSEGSFQPFTPMYTPQSRQELTNTLNTCLKRSSGTGVSKKGVDDKDVSKQDVSKQDESTIPDVSTFDQFEPDSTLRDVSDDDTSDPFVEDWDLSQQANWPRIGKPRWPDPEDWDRL